MPDGIQWGVTFGFYGDDAYFSSPRAFDEIDAIARTGANWVTVVATVWQDTCQSVSQYMDFDLTPSDLALKDIIDFAHAKGLKVCLRPMLECKDGYGRLAVWLPAEGGRRMYGRSSTARARWFESLKRRSAHYARVACRTGCEAFCIDSELDGMVEENGRWLDVLGAVRKAYPGPVTSCHTLHTGKVDFLRLLADPNHWFHALDWLSISYYCPARTPADAGKDISTNAMVRNLQTAKAKMKAIADALGKPVTFGECGCSSMKDGALHPSHTSPTAESDEDEQARYMDALFRTFAGEDWCRGFTWWKWDQNSLKDPQYSREQIRRTDFTLRGKKAEAVFASWARRQKSAAGWTLRVGTYNIRYPAAKDRDECAWDARKDDLAALVRSLDLDAFGLQEVVAEQADDLKARLPGYAMAGVHRDDGLRKGEASPVFYRTDRFDAVKSGTFWLSETPDVPGSKSWGTYCPRVCTWALLKDKATGRTFGFANAHTDHRSERARQEGMRLIMRRMREFAPGGTPVVFTGDHNCWETQEPARIVAAHLKNALYLSETTPKGPWRTLNCWKWQDREMSVADALKKPPETRDRPSGFSRIDYIYVSPGVRVKSHETIAAPRPGMNVYPSDHFPIVAEIELPPEQN